MTSEVVFHRHSLRDPSTGGRQVPNVYTTISAACDADRLQVGTVGWDHRGVPIAKDAAGWFVVGGGRIADAADRLPFVVPTPARPDRPGRDDGPCETCATETEFAARPEPAEPGALVDRVAELIRIEFPDTHPHSRVNRLRSESAASRIITFLAAASAVDVTGEPQARGT